MFVPGLGRRHRKSCPEGLALVGLHHHRPPHRDVHTVDTLRGPSQVNQDDPKCVLFNTDLVQGLWRDSAEEGEGGLVPGGGAQG